MGVPSYNQVPTGEASENIRTPPDVSLSESSTEKECAAVLVNPGDSSSNPSCGNPFHGERMTVDDAIERLGMGKFQLLVLTAAGMCFAADAMQVLLLSFLSEVLRLEWHLNANETAFITSMLFIGAIFGTLVLGPLADKKGRKPVFLLAGSIISIFGLAVGLCSNYWSLLSMLFLVGFGVG